MYHIGLIGSGGIAQMHAAGILAEPERFRLKAACDVNPTRLAEFGQKYGIADLVDDYRLILDDRQIDAVIILVPHILHEKICLEALEAGKHVLIEKPIARTLAEAKNMTAAAAKAGKTLMVAHNQRFNPIHIKIKEILDQGELGEVFCARTDHFQDFNPPAGSWWRRREDVGGGCVIGSGIHRLDLLRWTVGEIREIQAYQTYDPERLEAEVACTAILKFQSGAIGDFLCNWGISKYPYGESIAIYGKNGMLYSDTSLPHLIQSRKNVNNGELSPVIIDKKYDSMWAHFANCLDTGAIPLTSGDEGTKSLAAVLAANRSAETGQPVSLKNIARM